MARKIIFVCSTIFNNQLISHEIEALSNLEASNQFEIKYSIKPEIVYGPFYKRKRKIPPPKLQQNIKFKNSSSKKIEYNGWIINLQLLSEPINCAYISYIKRIDGTKKILPKGEIINIEGINN